MSEESERRAWHPAAQYSSRPMVRWLSPREMLRGGYGEFFGGLFGAFADSREAQAALRPATVHCRTDATKATNDFEVDPLSLHNNDGDVPGELWVDYVADIGDGFSSTYAIARQLARPTLEVPDEEGKEGEHLELPRGAMTVLGGDEVYPVAGEQHYRERTIGPYRTAFENVEKKTPLFAIPGNHDWYDGLVAFLEQFTVLRAPSTDSPKKDPNDPADPSRWTTHQTRSYFAVQLSERWWLWAIDIALDEHIDRPQMQYFRDLRNAMPAEARVILCTAEPAWLGRPRPSPAAQAWAERLRPYRKREAPEPDSWDRLRYFMKATLGETDPATGGDGFNSSSRPQVRLVISGDKHFYARHESDDSSAPTFVTAGGGGAYLSSTLDAHDTLDLPLKWYDQHSTEFNAEKVWPSREQSVRIGWTGLWRLPIQNLSLAIMFGFVYTLFGLAAWNIETLGDSPASRVDGLAARNIVVPLGALGQSPTGLVLGAVVALALIGLATAHRVPKLRAFPAALLHIGLHVVAVGATVWLSALAAQQDKGLGVLVVPIGITCIAVIEAWTRKARDESTDWRPSIVAALVTVILALALFGINLMNVEIRAYVFVMAAFGIGAAFGIFAFTLYLVFAQYVRVNLNELFVGLRHEGYKHFVRLRVTDDRVEAYVIGYEPVARRRIIWEDDRPQVTPTPKKVSSVGHKLIDHFTVNA